jgi:hypothetical protein
MNDRVAIHGGYIKLHLTLPNGSFFVRLGGYRAVS